MNTLLVGLALALGAPALKDPPAWLSVVGNWKLVEWIQSGAAMAFTDGAGVEFLPGGKRLWRDGPEAAMEDRSYTLGPKSTPAAIDLIKPDGGQEPIVHPSIFKIDGDTLVIAVGPPGGERPKTFDQGRERGRMLMTFERVKK